MDWLKLAKNLPQGQHTRSDCPECGVGTNTNAAIVNHNAKYYSIFCNACDHKDYESKGMVSLEERKRIQELNNEQLLDVLGRLELPKDTAYNPEDFPREARMWLFKSGLTPTVWKKYRIGYSKRLERVVLPIYDETGNLIWYQCRAILSGQKPKYLQPSRDKNNIVYTSGNGSSSDRAIIVEDIMSCIRVGEAATPTLPYVAVSLLGTKLSTGQAGYLSSFSRVTTWLDGDKAGINGARNIRRTMSLLCAVDNRRTELDPKCYSNKQIQEILL